MAVALVAALALALALTLALAAAAAAVAQWTPRAAVAQVARGGEELQGCGPVPANPDALRTNHHSIYE